MCKETQALYGVFGGVAQLGEHLPCKQGVRGSNPLISTSLFQSTKKRLVPWKPNNESINLKYIFCENIYKTSEKSQDKSKSFYFRKSWYYAKYQAA